MSTLENTAFIDSELSTRKTKEEDKDGTKATAVGVRHIFVFLGIENSELPPWVFRLNIFFAGFLGFANLYAMRVNLSVAIVYMVNNTALNENKNYTELNPADTKDGPFPWDESQQGIILGMFFYGYVLTQVPGGRMAEIVGGKWLMGVGVLVTAVFTLLTPPAALTNDYLLYTVRIIEGLGEGKVTVRGFNFTVHLQE